MSAPFQSRTGAVWGLPIMKFTLTYDGELPATGNGGGLAKRQRKWEIRKQLAPQLEHLWRVHPALLGALKNRWVPKEGPFLLQDIHHDAQPLPGRSPVARAGGPNDVDWLDLCAPIARGNRSFVPIVRKELALGCGLKVLFMRQEAVGRVYQGGDLDGRLKTLLDALSVPVNGDHVFPDETISEPIHCLMEDDSLLSGLSVETERLLVAPDAPESFVKLVVEVDVRVTDSRGYNHAFLGG